MEFLPGAQVVRNSKILNCTTICHGCINRSLCI
jgi:hypothetical protein